MTRSELTELELESARRREVLAAARGTTGHAVASPTAAGPTGRATVTRTFTDLTRALLGLPTQRA